MCRARGSQERDVMSGVDMSGVDVPTPTSPMMAQGGLLSYRGQALRPVSACVLSVEGSCVVAWRCGVLFVTTGIN